MQNHVCRIYIGCDPAQLFSGAAEQSCDQAMEAEHHRGICREHCHHEATRFHCIAAKRLVRFQRNELMHSCAAQYSGDPPTSPLAELLNPIHSPSTRSIFF
jgi:hypothetical protein